MITPKFKVGDRFFSVFKTVVDEHFEIVQVDTAQEFYRIRMDRKFRPDDDQMRWMSFKIFYSFARRGIFILDD